MTENNDFSRSARMKRYMRANKKNFIGLAICLGVLIIFLAIIIGSAAADSDDYLTYDNYEKIEIGMTYEEVREVLDNHNGKCNSKGLDGSVYTWNNDSGSCKIIISFDKDGKVANKLQSGLD